MTFRFWSVWLLVAGIIMVTFGAALGLLNSTPLFGWMHSVINPSFWPDPNSLTPAIENYKQFSMGLLGALMASWGVAITFLARHPFRRKERWVWDCLFLGVITWFFIDESLSVYHRVYLNAVGNLGFLALIGLPLLFTRKEFHSSPATK